MGLRINKNVRELDYHFGDDVVFGKPITRNLNKLNLPVAYLVTQNDEDRPDKVTREVFSSDELDWVVQFINGIKSNEIKEGTLIELTSEDVLVRYLSS